eukprot:scaffold8760_cov155-Amphora_coffeaeformis.AAC.1
MMITSLLLPMRKKEDPSRHRSSHRVQARNTVSISIHSYTRLASTLCGMNIMRPRFIPQTLFRRVFSSHPEAPLYRIIYFDSRGAAELTRYILAVAQVPYQDLRYPLQATATGFGVGGGGPSSASDDALSPQYLQDQKAGAFAVNMNKLPILQVLTPDGKAALATLGQSHAINRFLAERHGLMGQQDPDKKSIQSAQIDAIYESVRDIRGEFLRVKRTNPRDRSKWIENSLSEHCSKLEASLPPLRKGSDGSSRNSWIMGFLSLADIAVFSLLGTGTSVMSGSLVTALDDMDPTAAFSQDCPRLRASVQAIQALPAVQSWHAKRPDTFS